MASGDIKPPNVGRRGLHEYLQLFLVRLGPNGTDHSSHRLKITKLRKKSYFRGVYFILAANNLVIHIEGGRLPLFSFLFEASITNEGLTA